MGTTLTGKKVQNTYDSLLKLSDNDNLTTTAKIVGDGLGNNSPIYLSTSKVGINVTPTFEFQTNSHAKIGGDLTVGGNFTVNGTTTIVDSTVIAIGDNMMEMAKDNSSNTMDIGWYGTINSSGEKYVGVFYDASSGVATPEFHIGLGTVEPSSTAAWTVKGKLVIGGLDASGDISVAQTNKIRFDGFTGHTYITEESDSNLKFYVAGVEVFNTTNDVVDFHKPIDIVNLKINGGQGNDGQVLTSTGSGVQWEDSSGTIDGSGTANDVVMWQDSDTLTDAPIAISGNNATFAGEVLVPSGDFISWGTSGHSAIEGSTVSNNLKLRTNNTVALTLDSSQNATFAGKVVINNSSADVLTINRTTSAGGYMGFQNNGTNKFFIGSRATVSGSGGTGYDIYAVSGNDIRFFPGASLALTLDTSQNATFAGSVTANSFIKSGGTSSQFLMADGSINTGGFVTGTGVNNRIAIWNGTTAIDSDSDFYVDGDTIFTTNLEASGAGTFSGKITAGGGVQFTGGTIAAATAVLHTNNYLYFRGGTNGLIISGSDGSCNFRTTNSEVLWEIGSAEKMRLNSTGLGIGTSSPARPLSVNSSQIGARFTSSSADSQIEIVDSSGTVVFGSSSGNAIVQAGAAERMRITSAGNVGIGRTDPDARLDVKGAGGGSGLTFETSDSSNNQTFFIKDGGAAGLRYYPFSIGYTSAETIPTSNGLAIKHGTPTIHLTDSSSSGTLSLKLDGVNTTLQNFSTNGHISLITNGTGGVGIGTTSPDDPLHILGSANGNVNLRIENSNTGTNAYTSLRFENNSIDTGVLFLNSSNNTQYGGANSLNLYQGGNHTIGFNTNNLLRMAIKGNGNVGVGTNSPSVLFDARLSGTTGKVAEFHNSVGYGIGFTVESDGGVNTINSESNQALAFATNGASNERMRIKSAGEIGIGVIPESWTVFTPIQVGQASSFVGRTSLNQTDVCNNWYYDGAEKRINTGYAQRYVQDSSGDHYWLTGGTSTADSAISFDTRMIIKNAGNVGIGTTSPQTKLHIVGSNGAVTPSTFSVFDLTVADASEAAIGILGTNFSSIYFGDAGNPNQGAIVYNHISDSMDFRTNGNVERMRITSAGNVGIGTTAPIVPVHIVGTAVNNPSNGNGGYEVMQVFDNTSYATGVGGGIGLGGKFNSSGTDTIFSEIRGIKENSTDSNYAGALTFSTRANGANITERMRIDSSGRVGIGSTSPLSYNSRARDLVIKKTGSNVGISIVAEASGGTDYSSSVVFADGTGGTAGYRGIIEYDHSTDSMEFSTAATERMRITSAGYLGLATTSPSQLFHCNGNALIAKLGVQAFNAGFDFYNNGTTYLNGATTIDADLTISETNGEINFTSGNGYVQTTTGSTSLVFGTGSSERMRIHSTGRVAIGNTSPSYKLDVTGQIRATDDIIAFSDIRVKENVKTLENSLSKVNKLRGVEFNKIGNNNKSIGVIAQEIEKILPEVVHTDNDGMKSVAYGNITGLLIEAVKELSKEVQELKNQIK